MSITRTFAIVALVLLSLSTSAQKVVYLDSDYILKKLPAYVHAHKQLNDLTIKWQKHVEVELLAVEQMYKQFRAEEALYSKDMKRRKNEEIQAKEKAVKTLQQKYFGPEGELFKKRQELIAPIQDELYDAIRTVADKGNYSIVHDRAAGANIIYAVERYDISDDVLTILGI